MVRIAAHPAFTRTPAPPAPVATQRRSSLRNPWIVESGSAALILLAALMDATAPPELSAALFYMVPLTIVAWFGSVPARWRMALLALVAWSLLDAMEYRDRSPWLLFWGLAEKAVVFGGSVHLLASLKRSLSEKQRLNRLLGERLRLVEQLAAGVAHEVRNPLATMLSGIEYLQRRPMLEAEKLLVADMHDAVGRAERIVADLFDFSVPLRSHLVPIPLGPVIDQAVNEAQARAHRKGVVIAKDMAALPIIKADRTQVVQVLVNLLHNAIDASDTGGTVTIRATEGQGVISGARGRVLTVTVQDDGPGIPNNQLDKVFEPFFTTKAPGLGTGLGLAVSRRIVDEHGGTLTLSNRPDRGACATMTLQMEIEK